VELLINCGVGLTADQDSEAMHTSDAAEAELLSIVSKSHEI